ncbi:hypothetical protein V6N11_018400 [Hibiscus sabdariffa]|uniref:Uncharacterized protein n=1 Tax=Hibiscus sabdariffa TaxID=183260 RepID=A0ABR2T859_9ROSI
MEKPKKEEEKRPKASAQQRPASSRKYLKADILQLATAQNANTNFSARYSMIAAKNHWEEQGFFFDDSQTNYGLEQFVYNRLNELGWFRLARQPARANYNWIIEFYASNSAGEDHSTVHGRRVPANAATINAILGLPDNEPSF